MKLLITEEKKVISQDTVQILGGQIGKLDGYSRTEQSLPQASNTI